MGRYRFARSPRWVLTHLLVIAVVVSFVLLGFWQLRRLDERRDRNDLVEDRLALDATPIDGLDLTHPDDARFRRVTADGPMVGLRTVRTNQDGAPGFHVVSLVDLGDGQGVAVLRGFAGTRPDGSAPDVDEPIGPVEVDGLAIPLSRSTGPLRREIASLGDEVGLDVLPVLVQASSDPDADLTPVPTPTLDEGPHLSYAIQWFLFASVVIAGYPFLLRRKARDVDDEPTAATTRGRTPSTGGEPGPG